MVSHNQATGQEIEAFEMLESDQEEGNLVSAQGIQEYDQEFDW